jgi:hypothetical protein
MNRFDSQTYLDDWKASGRFPRIHDQIFAVVKAWAPAGVVCLDLCCCTGLLAQRLKDAGFGACGVDGDRDALERARAAGVDAPLIPLTIDETTLPTFGPMVAALGVGTVVARRCLPELSGGDPAMVRRIVDVLLDAGVGQLIIEGRVNSARSTHPLACVNDEIAATGLKVAFTAGNVAVLER